VAAEAKAGVHDPHPMNVFHEFFKFVVLIKEDHFSLKRLLGKFAQYLTGREPGSMHLREANCGFCRWPVEVLFDGEGHMFLHTCWEKFASAHNLEVGCLVNIKWEGDDELRVKVFDNTSCHRHYHGDNGDDGNGDEHKPVVWVSGCFSLQRRW
jgi:hypothetical protein